MAHRVGNWSQGSVTSMVLTATLDKLMSRLEVVGRSELNESDKTLVREALVMRLALLSDLTVGSPNHDIAVANWRRTILGLTTLDVESYASDWKTLREIVTSRSVRELYPDVAACKRAFKQLSAGRIHYKWTVSTTLVLVEGDDWFWRANQFIVFDSKLNLSSLDLTNECCTEYLAFEQSIPTLGRWRNPDGKGVRTLNVARRAAIDLAGQFRITDYPFRPSHGNGATAEVPRAVADAWHKNRQFRVDSEVIAYLRYRVPADDWRAWFYVPYRGLDRCSHVVCVPKSMTKNRTISKEPTTLQYLQQDVFRALDEFFTSTMHGRIDLHDQCRSRLLAEIGSADGSYATIDLSAASDSVTTEHVEFLFDGLPILYPLLATRSTHVEVTSQDKSIHEVLRTRKFAPMGSATCFPVESLVFAIMAEVAVRQTTNRASRDTDYVVYGDDIVIKTEFASALLETLDFFGFKVNTDKSFVDDNRATLETGARPAALFREACGIECLNGRDITPLKLSRRLVSLTMNNSRRQAGEGVGLIDLVNRSYLFGYSTLRKWLVSVLCRYKWFRTCQYVAASDYKQFVNDIRAGRQSSIRLMAPFVITDDACDTQWRAFSARYRILQGIQEPEALVTTVAARKPAKPAVRGPRPIVFRSPDSNRQQTRMDSNDYFTWSVNAVARNNAEIEYELDAMGIATLRARDLKWVTKWAILQRKARLTPVGHRK